MGFKRIKIERLTRDTTVLYAAITTMEDLYGDDYAGKLFTLMEVLMSPYVAALAGKPLDEVEQTITKAKERIISHLEQARLHACRDESIPPINEVRGSLKPADDEDDFALDPGIGESQDDYC
jgi:hypothetical protein